MSALEAGARRSTIMDTNSFRPEHAAALDAHTRELTARRQRVLGESYRLFYREPVHLVRGSGAYLWDADGRQYLDMYNNVPSIGHAHPAVVAAVHEQMSRLNIHTRYLHERILDYSDQLLATMPSELDRVMYLCTGSEANDLAIRVAREATGGRAVIVTREAYHGNTELVSAHSPSLGSGQAMDPDIILVDPPDGYRQRVDDLGSWFARAVREGIERSERRGVRVAALLMDSMFSSDGVFPATPGDLAAAVAEVRAHGGVVIADEVQPGFGRTGESFWGFGRHGLVPELVTLGKPMGNGIPISAVVAQQTVLAAFSDRVPYFNTFGGNPVSIAAAQATLRVIQEEQLMQRARIVGDQVRAALVDLSARHPLIGDVRGAGQFTGLELVVDRDTREPASAAALDVIEGLRRRRVLTSVAGPEGNVLKLRPPLAFGSEDISWLIEALDESLTDAAIGG